MELSIKAISKMIDQSLLGGSLIKLRNLYSNFEFENKTRRTLGNKLEWYTPLNGSPALAELCDKYGSDKGSINGTGKPYSWPAHSYTEVYTILFEGKREFIKNVFECGLGTNFDDIPSSMGSKGKPGASLRVWRDYFPHAHVIGADIDRRVLFAEERIETYFVDQTDANSIRELWSSVGVSNFDLMIDDGLHTFEAGKTLFENSFSQLSHAGVYIIEDVSEADILKYQKYFEGKSYRINIVRLHRLGLSLGDNSLVIIYKN